MLQCASDVFQLKFEGISLALGRQRRGSVEPDVKLIKYSCHCFLSNAPSAAYMATIHQRY